MGLQLKKKEYKKRSMSSLGSKNCFLTLDEIARIEGTTKGAIAKTLSRALKKVEKLIKKNKNYDGFY